MIFVYEHIKTRFTNLVILKIIYIIFTKKWSICLINKMISYELVYKYTQTNIKSIQVFLLLYSNLVA
jgi:hypothetical protein